VAAAASGRNGGHVNNGTAVDVGSLAAKWGEAHAHALYHAYDDAVDTVERIVREQQITCDFRRCGKIKLAAKPTHYEGMARGFARLQKVDPDTELVPPERVRDEVASDQFHGGLLYKKSAQMHMGRFGAGLAGAAARHGARIFEGAPVTGLKRLPGGTHLVSTPRGNVTAKQVLVATGASQRGPFFWFRRRMVPIGSFIIATAPLSPQQIDSIMPTRRNATTSLNIGNYFRIAPDNRLIWGGRARFALSSPTSDLKSGQVLEAGLRRTFPQLDGVAIDYCWGGIIDLTQDRMPRAGEHRGLFYAMGYSGHGVQMSVHMGQQMARIMGGEANANPFGFMDWKAIPGHFGPPWFMPLVGAYYRWKDRVS
jgi:glycine/D-amino acid oxidase-like deaminating enzyme